MSLRCSTFSWDWTRVLETEYVVIAFLQAFFYLFLSVDVMLFLVQTCGLGVVFMRLIVWLWSVLCAWFLCCVPGVCVVCLVSGL